MLSVFVRPLNILLLISLGPLVTVGQTINSFFKRKDNSAPPLPLQCQISNEGSAAEQVVSCFKIAKTCSCAF